VRDCDYAGGTGRFVSAAVARCVAVQADIRRHHRRCGHGRTGARGGRRQHQDAGAAAKEQAQRDRATPKHMSQGSHRSSPTRDVAGKDASGTGSGCSVGSATDERARRPLPPDSCADPCAPARSMPHPAMAAAPGGQVRRMTFAWPGTCCAHDDWHLANYLLSCRQPPKGGRSGRALAHRRTGSGVGSTAKAGRSRSANCDGCRRSDT
jgi:hypothetical protein